MYPHGRSLVKTFKDQPFAILGVNSDTDLEMVKAVVKEEKISWRSFWNGPRGTRGPISTEWNVNGWPTTFLIDAQGRIRYHDPDPARIEELVRGLLAEGSEQPEAPESQR